MKYVANPERYSKMQYNRLGKSGLKLSALALGLWHNFGSGDNYDNMVNMITTAFDNGIIHFDLANNYGPYEGSAEENFGKILKSHMMPYRDELIISTKAGYGMWDGPYGDWGSRKYLISSIDQSLKRMELDYVDIFYHHRPDPETPIQETAGALDQIVRSGKALYVGVSNYNAEQTKAIAAELKRLGTPFVIHQPKYNMFDRWIENGLLDVLEYEGLGSIAFCPLAQGLLTNKYINGIPEGSRATKSRFLTAAGITDDKLEMIVKLNKIAETRGQTLAEMALAWALQSVTCVLIGASRPSQIEENVKALNNLVFTQDELNEIDKIVGKK